MGGLGGHNPSFEQTSVHRGRQGLRDTDWLRLGSWGFGGAEYRWRPGWPGALAGVASPGGCLQGSPVPTGEHTSQASGPAGGRAGGIPTEGDSVLVVEGAGGGPPSRRSSPYMAVVQASEGGEGPLARTGQDTHPRQRPGWWPTNLPSP